MIKTFKIFLSTIFITQALFANISKPTIQDEEKGEVLIGYYGRPHAASLGVLGENNIDELVKKMKKKQAYFEKELNHKMDVKLAFHIIYSLATKDPGRKKDYLLKMSDKVLMKYIKRAQKENFLVFIDLQLGTLTPAEAIKPVLKYLKYENVHLAIDPEFKIPKHRKYPPGKYIGHIFSWQLNEAQDLISDYLIANNIVQRKKLIVHMFHKRMLRNKNEVKLHDNIELIYNIDGHGTGQVKIKIYNGLYAISQTNKAEGGFKIFYNNDKKPIMTPKQIMGIEPVGNQKIMVKPYYINYH
ncbi:hypothetical protein CRU98_03170 [Arcobacter sp. CECT 8986]|uniref:hypothetical protein n=1 Tax=Arcobacter sp. CECT 8986 TaxID=2044507 RepID=UPI0010099943|nr:hypothetical protein [Arcobacter sp. CECT 8986]RXK00171.1 hypothetical protein CRU98_03170 [Arcobacter sp. CECT 8986]